MSDQVVFDSSALIAFLMNEQGASFVEQHIDAMAISTVNYAEVLSVLNRLGRDTNNLEPSFFNLQDFTTEDSMFVGSIYQDCVKLGLSLGDRACLSLGKRLKAKTLTADHAWKKLAKKLDLKIEVIR